MRKNENNQVIIAGEVLTQYALSHESNGEKFYTFDVKVDRISDNFDVIPVMVSERMVDVKSNIVGCGVMINGRFSSYNKHEDNKSRLILNVFAQDIQFAETIECYQNNEVYLDGFICKQPVYRLTPSQREIADVLVAVNRPYGKTDYIPCILWGRNARYLSTFNVGDRVIFTGRIQSREYIKRLADDVTERRIAYEVSVSKVEEAGPDEEV